MAYVDNHLTAISSHDQSQELVTVCEPVIVSSAFITGAAIDTVDTWVRIVGWEQLPSFNGEMVERRIVTRLAMSDSTARELMCALRRALVKGGN